MRRAALERYKSFLIYRNSFIEAVVPQSYNTVANWILRTFVKIKLKVAISLANCKARIALLALRNTFGSKSSEEQKHYLLEVLREYKITSKISFFISDSTSNNDKALKLLANVDTDCISEVCRTANNPDKNDDLSIPSVTQFEQILRTKDRQAILRA
ncbi:hypothetical protein M433DRAFT_160228 [Acidomyces richmondensis BFW]|nr:MAG: hypothetical protein FE78DRAFT_90176 [Acidomyces sp. 'richmondensis']KYG40574.1 hypothetical protein M433DRAFT_160228 [Acidomyces richmondensis BFW]